MITGVAEMKDAAAAASFHRGSREGKGGEGKREASVAEKQSFGYIIINYFFLLPRNKVKSKLKKGFLLRCSCFVKKRIWINYYIK